MWEEIGNKTQRLRVPDGWLLRTQTFAMGYNGGEHCTLFFLQDMYHTWKLEEKKMNDNVIWGNENPDGPNNDPHPKDCKCIDCEVNRGERCKICDVELFAGQVDYCTACSMSM